ncbi:Sulfotransferase family cytosolic 1B member 1 [Seminavis robusta]|uniref:Sulfotransferase family cytosolic 1B member 1 n=1 Tax=Seminavis robusta TaxID=568900 RepID=A0A9N8EY70_9STRA|nr:Sulfotransferase family cytosolic 1B member 1 [Seminavis robusta]|eukprot:Sro2441_g327740.1 Sulfotransferase family cytosolic 1B member 1 (400) ;mRNA; f:9283-10628
MLKIHPSSIRADLVLICNKGTDNKEESPKAGSKPKVSLVQLASAIVLLTAVSIGVIGKTKPGVFLRIPQVGFIFWAITGNPVPPYFDEGCLYESNFKQQVQDGDVIVSSGAKAGTLWLQNIVFLLRSGGWDDFDSLTDTGGSCEFLMYPEHTMEQRLQEVQEKRRRMQERGIQHMQHFTHQFPAPHLYGLDPAKNPNIKYLAIVRHGKEVVRSIHPFINGHTEEFRTMWGGFPPKFKAPQDTLKFFIQDVPDLYFGHLLAWWKVKDLSNVLLIHFADLRHNPRQVIQDIAQFLNVQVDDDLMQVVLDKTSHEYMSSAHNQRTFKYEAIFGYPHEKRRPFVQEGVHISKEQGGRLDRGGEFFTKEMSQQWEAAMQQYFGHDPVLMKFANEGSVALNKKED